MAAYSWPGERRKEIYLPKNKKRPNIKPKSKPMGFDEALEKGFRQFRDYNYSAAIQLFSSAISMDFEAVGTRTELALMHRGFAYSAIDKNVRAIKDLDEVISKNPRNTDALIGRAICYGALRQNERALEDFDRATTIDNSDADPFYRRGSFYLLLEKYDLASKDFDDAISRNPYDADALNGRGQAYFGLGKNQLALKDFDEAIKLDPKSGAAFNNRAGTYFMDTQYDRALKDIDQAIHLERKDEGPTLFAHRGMIHWHMKLYDQAIEDCTNSLKLASDWYLPYLIRASSYGGKQVYDQAAEDIDKLVRLFPDFHEDSIIDKNWIGTLQVFYTPVYKALDHYLKHVWQEKTAEWYYFSGVQYLYSSNRGQAKTSFLMAQKLGYENNSSVEQHLENLVNL